jgi:hypothetical protein
LGRSHIPQKCDRAFVKKSIALNNNKTFGSIVLKNNKLFGNRKLFVGLGEAFGKSMVGWKLKNVARMLRPYGFM